LRTPVIHLSAVAALTLIYSGAGIATASAQSAAQEKDNSGTNPAQITRSLTVQNVYNRLDRSFYNNVATLRYNEPLFDGTWGLRLSAPFAFTNVTGRDTSGFGDVAAKLTWIAHLDQRQAIVFSGEVAAPTAVDKVLGTGRWVGSPGVTYAWFVNPEIIIAPALIHNMSFGQERGRAQVNRTDFDFYTVYKPTGQNWWLTSDVTISRDWETKTTPMSWRVALGSNIGKLPGGGAVNLSIRPGVGFGPDKPFRWSLEAGISIVGF
jgi:hypothetical protein